MSKKELSVIETLIGIFQGQPKDGEHIEYFDNDENGQIEVKGHFKYGEMVGEWIDYYENGQIFTRKNYDENGKEDGVWVEYHEDGTIVKEEVWKDGKIINSKFY
tara:strand:+ start:497 stop:808 length:312 start_codon:yes stop_codon:yes gene_type:complete